jgi:hypothetical protein
MLSSAELRRCLDEKDTISITSILRRQASTHPMQRKSAPGPLDDPLVSSSGLCCVVASVLVKGEDSRDDGWGEYR